MSAGMKCLGTAAAFAFMTTASVALAAERIANPFAVFAGLDKITGVTTTFESKVGEERRFGVLIVKAEACFTRPQTEEPKTAAFVQIDEIAAGNSRKRVFSGWMFAESPGLNALEHPVYDVWLTGCRDPNAPPPMVETPPDDTVPQEGAEEEEEPQD
jgi:hypothetical protein